MKALLLMQLPPHALGKAVEDGTSDWTPITPVGDKDAVPGFWFQSGPDTAGVGIWGNQPVDKRTSSLSLSPSLFVTLTFEQ